MPGTIEAAFTETDNHPPAYINARRVKDGEGNVTDQVCVRVRSRGIISDVSEITMDVSDFQQWLAEAARITATA